MVQSKTRVELEKMRLDSGKEWREVAKELDITNVYLSMLINEKTSKQALDRWLPLIKNKLK